MARDRVKNIRKCLTEITESPNTKLQCISPAIQYIHMCHSTLWVGGRGFEKKSTLCMFVKRLDHSLVFRYNIKL